MINRFEWIKAVLQSTIPDRGKALAAALAVQFANDETGLINPSIPTLAAYLSVSPDTVKRAVADLVEGGWVGRIAGHGRHNRCSYTLLSPGKVYALRSSGKAKEAASPASVAEKRGQNCTDHRARKGGRTAPKRGQNCTAHIRQEQSSEQRARASEPRQRPAPHLCTKVQPNTPQAEAWTAWLWERGLPSLTELPALDWGTAYCLPWSTPPTKGDETGEMIAARIIDWAMNHELKSRKHGRAA